MRSAAENAGEASKQLEIAQRELTGAREACAVAEAKVSELNTANSKLKADHQISREAAEKSRAELEQKEIVTAKLKTMCLKLKERAASVEAASESASQTLQSALEEERSNATKLRADLERLESSNAQQAKDLEQMRAAAENAGEASKQLEIVQKELTEAREACAVAKAKVSELDTANSKLKADHQISREVSCEIARRA